MDSWMIKPRDFDPTKKYPVFVFVYGEPASQMVLDDWQGGQGFSLFHRAVADHGLSEGEGTRVHVQIARYLIEHLPPGPR